ncbi:MAG: hypothetical protein ACXWXF_03925 [Aeromicrobium sp.]
MGLLDRFSKRHASDDTGAQHQKDVGVADVARADETATARIPGLSKLGLRFDIDKLDERGDGGYGFEAWKVLWSAVDPTELGVALLFEGDTMATLRRSENVFCIAIQADEPSLRRVRDAVTQNADFRTVAAAPDQIEGDALVAEPLVSAGEVDASGNLGDAFWAGAALNSIRAESSAPAADSEAPEVEAPEVEVPAVDEPAPIPEAQDTPSPLGPSCPDCGSVPERAHGSPVSPYLDVLTCRICGWTALGCGSTGCTGHLVAEATSSPGTVRYTCATCGWTGTGIPF